MIFGEHFMTIIIDILMVLVIVLSLRRAVRNSSERKGTARDRASADKFNDLIKNYNAVNSSKVISVRKHDGMTLMDDRANDWMAKQLKDEAIAMVKVSDMFKIKQEHANKCDAEFIRRFHESTCDAEGIDDGTHKNGRKK